MTAVWLVLSLILLGEASVWLAFRRWRLLRSRRLLRPITQTAAHLVLPLVVLAAYAWLAPLESPYARIDAPGTVVIDAYGNVLQRDTSKGLRIPVALDDVAPVAIDATIAAEDQRFRSHPGIDPIAVGRALITLPFHRSGASTLSQQLARRVYLDGDEPLLERKAREALIALQLEAHYSKDEILDLYLNNVYYGRGAYGIEAAARIYFGTSAANLDLAQASFLAGLPQLPAVYGAEPDSTAMQARQKYVLDRLLDAGGVDPVSAGAALAEPLQLLPEQAPVSAPHFVDYVMAEMQSRFPQLAGKDGLVIETTLDLGLQQQAEQTVRYRLSQLEDKNVGNAAVVVLEPKTGRILTMVGGVDYQYGDAGGGSQINMALQPRQPGSALKPFLYATALAQGFTAATPLLDVPTSFVTEGGTYEPLDYDRTFHGPVSLREALASSLNVPAVRTLSQVGMKPFLDTLHRVGLNTLGEAELYGLSLTLGGGEVRLLDLTNAYAALSNGGMQVQPYAIESIRDSAGRVLYQHQEETPSRVLDADVSYVIGDIISDPAARELGFGDTPTLTLPFRTGVKTGTTTEFRDNWTLGFTPERVVGVWAGNTDNESMQNVSGLDGAGPIWHAVMEAAMRDVTPTWPNPPSDLVRASVCSPTGLIPGPDCAVVTNEWFLPGTVPTQVEDYYQRDASGTLRINPPAEARGWAIAAGLPLFEDGQQSQAFVVQPANGAVLFLAPELQAQQVLLKASPPAGARSIEFDIDGATVATATPDDPTAVWALAPGDHTLQVTARLDDGTAVQASSRFEVKP